MKGKDVIAMLKKEGWLVKRVTGSHCIIQKKGCRLDYRFQEEMEILQVISGVLEYLLIVSFSILIVIANHIPYTF
jgi:hypothetical protein